VNSCISTFRVFCELVKSMPQLQLELERVVASLKGLQNSDRTSISVRWLGQRFLITRFLFLITLCSSDFIFVTHQNDSMTFTSWPIHLNALVVCVFWLYFLYFMYFLPSLHAAGARGMHPTTPRSVSRRV
jgi:hypothetical protein